MPPLDARSSYANIPRCRSAAQLLSRPLAPRAYLAAPHNCNIFNATARARGGANAKPLNNLAGCAGNRRARRPRVHSIFPDAITRRAAAEAAAPFVALYTSFSHSPAIYKITTLYPGRHNVAGDGRGAQFSGPCSAARGLMERVRIRRGDSARRARIRMLFRFGEPELAAVMSRGRAESAPGDTRFGANARAAAHIHLKEITVIVSVYCLLAAGKCRGSALPAPNRLG